MLPGIIRLMTCDISVPQTSFAIGGQADPKLGVKPLMPPRPLTFAMLAGKRLFLAYFLVRNLPATLQSHLWW
jgi:hypothetical protein